MNVRTFAALFVLGSMGCGGAGDDAPAIPDDQSASSTSPPAATTMTPAKAPATPTAAPTQPAPGPTAPLAPSGLTCLAKHFVGTPTLKGSAWSLVLPSAAGAAPLPWNDGKTKTFDVKMETPDLHDMLSMPYTLGPITPDNTLNADPGRIRNETLFMATYGASAAAVQSQLVQVDFVGQSVSFHPRAAAALSAVSTKIKALIATTPSLSAFVTGELGGTFDWRPIANTTRMSAHSYGIAIDIVVAKSNYWEWEKDSAGNFVWKNEIPQSIVDAFESEGFAWGGRWYHYDTMHFEWRPELFDKQCTP